MRRIILTMLFLNSCFYCQADLLSQIDTFESGTMGWGGNLSVTLILTGGPGNSAYRSISQTEFYLGTKNISQWSGNYLGNGITGINMNLKHLSGNALKVRILLFGRGGTLASAGLQPVSGSWNSHYFGLTALDQFNQGSSVVMRDSISRSPDDK